MTLVEEDEVLVETRDTSPSHLFLKLESVSTLLNGDEKYKSGKFVAGGYNWRLIIYPNGKDHEGNEGDHVTVNLAVAKRSSLPSNWEIKAFFNILLFNQILGNYLSVRGKVRQFHGTKPEWGLSKFISKKVLNEPSNGYVIDDCCVFGAEIFILKNELLVERLSILEAKKPYVHSLKISKFSKLGDHWLSEEFSACSRKWQIQLYPKGKDEEKGHSTSIYLYSVDCKRFAPHEKLKVDYIICIKNQVNDKQHQKRGASNRWFTSSDYSWGWQGSYRVPI